MIIPVRTGLSLDEALRAAATRDRGFFIVVEAGRAENTGTVFAGLPFPDRKNNPSPSISASLQ